MPTLGKPGFGILLLTQSLSGVGELCGQRMGRRLHGGSNVRMLLSVCVYSAVQAWVVTTICELALPESTTGGQGGLSMWRELYEHPALWINAFNNTIYWVAQVYVLREPLGVVLVVLAFLVASFCVDPFGRIAGIAGIDAGGGNLSIEAVALGVIGALMCLWEFRASTARAMLRWICCGRVPPALVSTSVGGSESGGDTEATAVGFSAIGAGGAADGAGDATDDIVHTPASSAHGDANGDDNGDDTDATIGLTSGISTMSIDGGASSSGAAPATPQGPLFRASFGGLVLAFCVLALTAGIGIVITVYFEREYAMTGFGYAAVDQVLLSITSWPVFVAACYVPWLARVVGEPEAEVRRVEAAAAERRRRAAMRRAGAGGGSVSGSSGGLSPGVAAATDASLASPLYGFGECVKQTWRETHMLTLVLFRGCQFGREFLFFFLATKFDLSTTYLEMTLLRVVLSWLASLAAVTALRGWVGVAASEVAAALAPVNLAWRLAGSAVVVLSMLLLNEVL